MNFKISALHPKSTKPRIFILNNYSYEEVALDAFQLERPHLKVLHCEPLTERRECKRRDKYAPYRIRNHYKARLCQVRGNLQSMTDSEEGLLTIEEILSLQRISRKLDRVIELFNTRNIDIKNDGKL